MTRRRMLAVIAILVGLPLLAAGSLAGLFYFSVESNISVLHGDPFPSSRPAASNSGAENILLLGSDTRGAALGDVTSGKSTGQRSDTLLLVHIPSDHTTVQVMSIMRDLWVPIPGHGPGKINAAFSYGGVPLVIGTVEQLLGARIDHVAILDFDGFAKMSSALGGVDVQSPKAFASKNLKGYSFTKGTNHVEGERALSFVRERYSFPDSDYQRVRNQQSFLKGVLGEVTAFNGVADLAKLNSFAGVTSSFVTVDKGLGVGEIVKTGYALRSVRADDVHFFTLPTLGTGTSSDGQSVVLMNPTAISEISAALRSDTFESYLAAHHLTNGN